MFALFKNLHRPVKRRTSAEWQCLEPEVEVLDPDGWDRKNYHYSWFQEKITYEEYATRQTTSTLKWHRPPSEVTK
jgi:hypothetical protein